MFVEVAPLILFNIYKCTVLKYAVPWNCALAKPTSISGCRPPLDVHSTSQEKPAHVPSLKTSSEPMSRLACRSSFSLSAVAWAETVDQKDHINMQFVCTIYSHKILHCMNPIVWICARHRFSKSTATTAVNCEDLNQDCFICKIHLAWTEAESKLPTKARATAPSCIEV